MEDGTKSFYENVLSKAPGKYDILLVPKSLVYDKIWRFMSENEFFRKSIVFQGNYENAKQNYLIYNGE